MPDAAVSEARARMIEVNGARLWLREWGPKNDLAPLVLCDGLGCDGYIWRYLIAALCTQRRIILLNYRGHGRSELPADLATLNVVQLVDDLRQALKQLAVTRAVLLGHSMGVQICLEFVRAQPATRVVGLALLCGTEARPIDHWHGRPQQRDALERGPPVGNRVMRGVFDVLTRTSARHWPKIKAAWTPLMRTNFVRDTIVDGELSRALLRLEDFAPYMDHLATLDMRVFALLARDLAEHTATDVLPGIDVPALVVGGARDRFCPLWLSQRMFGQLGSAHHEDGHRELVRLARGSHVAPLEEPTIVGNAVARLLNAIDSGTSAS